MTRRRARISLFSLNLIFIAVMRLDEVPLGIGATGKPSDQASLKEIGTIRAR